MIETFEIKGGPGEYEAAVLSAVFDQIRRRRRFLKARRPHTSRPLSAWMKAGSLTSADPMPRPDPGSNGDTAPNTPPERHWLAPPSQSQAPV